MIFILGLLLLICHCLIKKDCVSMRFQLDLGMHPCRELQEDYTKTGLEVFRFDTIELTEDEGRLEALKEGMDLYS